MFLKIDTGRESIFRFLVAKRENMAELTLQESERGVSSNEAHSDPHLPSVKYIVSTSKQGNILLRNQNGTEVVSTEH